MIQIKKYGSTACALALVSLFASQAFALITSGHGSVCMPDDQNDVFTRTSSGYTFTSGGDVHCSLVTTNAISQIRDADVQVDLLPNTTATCCIIGRTFTGTSLGLDCTSTSSDAVGANVDLLDPEDDPIPMSAVNRESASLRCTMPAGGRILAYTFND